MTDPQNLLERLRGRQRATNLKVSDGDFIREAADTIEALLKQLENARSEALEEAARVADHWAAGHPYITAAIRSLKRHP